MIAAGDAIGPYRIDAPLGEGGMGAVYRAFDTRLHRSVAIKVLPNVDSGSSEARARMTREARAAAALSHPNLVAVYDVGEHDGMPYIAMELVEGSSLRAFVGDETVTYERRIRWLREIAQALDAAHRRGLVHRDIKPENVVIAREGDVAKVLDFGIARRSSSVDPLGATGMAGIETITTKGIAIGTPLYMAPEQVRGEDVDARADQFAWGVLAYELLSGRSPWRDARDAMSLAAAITSQTPEPLDCEIAAAIARALQKRSADRFPSMSQLIEQLARPARPARAARWLPVAIALAIGLSVAGGLALRRPAPPTPAAVVVAPSASAPAITLLTQPRSTSKVPGAAEAYSTAMLSLHDGNWQNAIDQLERAHELDPYDPLILVRRAILAAVSNSAATADRRARFTVAHGARDRLSPRDAGLLLAIEPLALRDPANFDEAFARLQKLAVAHPNDAEIVLMAGDAAYYSGLPAASIPFFERAASLDPKYSDAYQGLAISQEELGHREEAIVTLRRCVDEVPASGDCLVAITIMLGDEGRCEETEAYARQSIALQPTERNAHRSRPDALWALGRDPAVVHAALEARWNALPPKDRAAASALDESRLSLLAGNFKEAERYLGLARTAVAASADTRLHAEVAEVAVWLFDELGDVKAADAIAAEYLAKSAAWVTVPRYHADPAPFFLGYRRLAGAITIEQLERDRGAWIQKWRLQVQTNVRHWAAAYASTAVDGELATKVLAALPKGAAPTAWDVRYDPHIGRALLLAGRVPEAIASLSHVVKHCRTLSQAAVLTRSQLWLAEARAATGDTAGACTAVAVVLKRFGNEPRSVTAKRARLLSPKLSCKAP